ncbi:MAG TPA: NrfD/PsrC family molybdoenzyme membrane anchor subunit [Terriglobales bacterium]|nr:NrfD/PsrC family molybdoenzyme membrane anchor subunit [Terriglobales bacterium]
MSRVPLPELPGRVPDAKSESRLAEIRRNASDKGIAPGEGVVPSGAPFPRATAQTGYYGVPLLKEPQWNPEVPLYFFVGGAAGASAVIANAASWLQDDPELVQRARWVAAAGGALSSALLIKDLGVPSRFLNMLRVFKPQSPMSMGAWTLSAFSTFSAASAFANLMRQKLGASIPISILENAAGTLAAATGLVMASYTGVLIGATVVPVWNRNVGTLPLHFAASGMNSAVSILELLGAGDRRALNLLGLGAATYEVYEGFELETKRDRVNEPLRKGWSGAIVRAGGVLSGPVPLGLRVAYAITGNKSLRRAAAWSSIAGSLLTRYGWVQAGRASARDHRIPLELGENVEEIRKTTQQLAKPA